MTESQMTSGDFQDFICKVGIVKEENCKIHGF